MPSLQKIEKIAERLEQYTTYKTLQAQANARYILYGVHEDEKNFPLFDQRLTFRTEHMAYLCLEVACAYYNNERRDSAAEYFNRGALLLEYNYANSQTEEQVRGFNLMVCGLAYYCACQYSKAFVTISKGRYEGRSLIRAPRWMMLYTRNSREPVTWKWYLTESFPKRGCSPR